MCLFVLRMADKMAASSKTPLYKLIGDVSDSFYFDYHGLVHRRKTQSIVVCLQGRQCSGGGAEITQQDIFVVFQRTSLQYSNVSSSLRS